MSSDSSDAFCYFFQWYIIHQLFIVRMWPSWNCVVIAPKWAVPNGNHMNDDVAEVNGLSPPMLPGCFLHKIEPGYEARPKLCVAELYLGSCLNAILNLLLNLEANGL